MCVCGSDVDVRVGNRGDGCQQGSVLGGRACSSLPLMCGCVVMARAAAARAWGVEAVAGVVSSTTATIGVFCCGAAQSAAEMGMLSW